MRPPYWPAVNPLIPFPKSPKECGTRNFLSVLTDGEARQLRYDPPAPGSSYVPDEISQFD
jgi:hypothetical protein